MCCVFGGCKQGDWFSQHPSDKQTPARYLADQALKYVFGKNTESIAADFPLYSMQRVSSNTAQADGTQVVEVTVSVRAGLSTAPVPLTTTAPFPATQSSLLGCANNQSCLTSSNCGNNYSCKQSDRLYN